jgi:hypothetical protein
MRFPPFLAIFHPQKSPPGVKNNFEKKIEKNRKIESGGILCQKNIFSISSKINIHNITSTSKLKKKTALRGGY